VPCKSKKKKNLKTNHFKIEINTFISVENIYVYTKSFDSFHLDYNSGENYEESCFASLEVGFSIAILLSCPKRKEKTKLLTPKGPLSLWGTNGILGRYLQSQFLS